MKNKYYLANVREARIVKFNTFLVEKSLKMTLAIPKNTINLVVRVVKRINNKIENKRLGLRNPIYNHLEIPECCFKNNNSKSIMRI